MLAKKVRALQRSDFRPIANIRVFYTAFVFMILAWMEPILESHQPEEYLGFRQRPPLEELLLTANRFLDKISA